MAHVTSDQLDRENSGYSPQFQHFEENRIVHEAYGRWLADLVVRNGFGSVLSLGIGHMEVAWKMIAALGKGGFNRYAIVDGSPTIISSFKESIGSAPQGLEVIHGFFESFEHPSRFDVIEAGFILEHVEDPSLILHRIKKFMKPGSMIVVAVPNAKSLHRLLGNKAGMLDDVFRLSDADRALGHRRYWDLPSLLSLLESAGYQVVRKRGLLLKPFTTAQLSQLQLTPAVWNALMLMAENYPEISNAFCIEATL